MSEKKELQWQRNTLKEFKKKNPSKINIENKKIFKEYNGLDTSYIVFKKK